MLAKNTDDKYRKNRKNNKCNKIRDLEREEVKKGVEMFANVSKIAKVTRIFLVGLKYRVTNIAKTAITILTKFQTVETKKWPRRTSKSPQTSQK